jgi:hypothetical protein
LSFQAARIHNSAITMVVAVMVTDAHSNERRKPVSAVAGGGVCVVVIIVMRVSS